ncbi:Coenzyme PQQ synthesis protein D (PqqD) [Amycolatopsis arida]|uniref:Coenzyme PQQ synthesis protein D (PqqD) n=1 Tax=Amycolatopsis arida TaxID=587909 RepID=A0A1I5YYA1_9PSEU|nr:lasso peptide biosynthesis PqqD family chaperone [Amycolatopsis arida]TDX89954.1 coenzyme PQQ synthesis protein D (PqqD) [Amycolatopsis arida]SFQ48817.1 Coenzyme PQQ synthesis protein D (PqqD) [Amycolatopsis arida]
MSLRLRPDVSLTDTEYGTVLLDERSGRYWQLNPTATVVVRTLLDGGDAEAAVSALAGEYAVAEDRARNDVTSLVDGLRSAGLVTS